MGGNVIIRTDRIFKSFSGVQALTDVSLSVSQGSIRGLIGPNGAGKSTLLDVINRILEPDSGDLFFGRTRLIDRKLYEVAGLGLSRTFQIPRVFRRLSVWENMIAPTIIVKERMTRKKQRIRELLDLVGLTGESERYAMELSGGQQKLLEFARAMITAPKVVLMDEPFAGVHPEIRARLITNIKRMNELGTTFLLVSHDMRSVKDLCDEVTVLSFGAKLTEGPTDSVLADERVVEAYLGE